MSGARRAAACALLALAACGGGDDGAEIAATPLAAIDPCGLLPADEASRLSGAQVEVDATAATSSLGTAVGCTYRFPEGGDEVSADLGGAVAASLVVVEPEVPPREALDSVVAEAAEGGFEVADVEVGDAATKLVSATEVQVVTVVETVVVVVTIVPGAGEVDEALVEDVVAFTETTVEPVKAALAGEDGGDGEVILVGELEGLWTGDWGTMALRVEGEQVLGAYTHDEGRIVGTFADGLFVGRWTEVPTRAEPSDAGDVEFRFTTTGDGLSLDGRWRFGSEEEFREDWDLALSDEDVPEELVAAFEDESSFVEGTG